LVTLSMPVPVFIPVWPPGPLAARVPVPGCGPGRQPPALRAVCALGTAGGWVTHLPVLLAHLARHYAWPGLPVAAVAVPAAVVAWHAAGVLASRRAAAGGWTARVVPPRALDPAQDAQAWDLLASLARCAAHGWRGVPVAFEVHAGGGELSAGLWLPARVSEAAVAAVAAEAWPGARVGPGPLPALPASGTATVAGCRLAAVVPESRWLVRPDLLGHARRVTAGGEAAEPLRSVLSALAGAATPMVLQVLARPLPRRRRRALAGAARHGGTPVRPLPLRAITALLDFLQRVPASQQSRPGGRADPLAATAAREAAEKTAARPELLAAIRIGATGPRRVAAGAARHAADGYVLASRSLLPVRLHRAGTMLTGRRAGRREWLVMSASELGVLAHLPADPARYQFTTAARHRPHPHAAYLATPEPATATRPGWTRHGWASQPSPDTGGEHDEW
jgi:hypothetical protein